VANNQLATIMVAIRKPASGQCFIVLRFINDYARELLYVMYATKATTMVGRKGDRPEADEGFDAPSGVVRCVCEEVGSNFSRANTGGRDVEHW